MNVETISETVFLINQKPHMLKVTLLYGQPTDEVAFENYYKPTHIPLASKMQGVVKLELTKCLPNPDGTTAAYYRMAELYFENLKTM